MAVTTSRNLVTAPGLAYRGRNVRRSERRERDRDPPGRSSKTHFADKGSVKASARTRCCATSRSKSQKARLFRVIGPSGSGNRARCCVAWRSSRPRRPARFSWMVSSSRAPGGNGRPRGRIWRKRPEIGMVFQNFNLWPHRTALGNIIEAPIRVKGLPRHEAIRLGSSCCERLGFLTSATNIRRSCPGASSSVSPSLARSL